MKKTLLIVFLGILCLSVKAQNQKPEVDSIKKYLQFTVESSSDHILLVPVTDIEGKTEEKYSYTIHPECDVTNKFIAISYNIPEIGCVELNGKIAYLFTDNSKYMDSHSIIRNCTGLFLSLYSRWPDTQVAVLKEFDHSFITSVSLQGTDHSATIKLSRENAELLKMQIKWLKYYYENKSRLGKMY